MPIAQVNQTENPTESPSWNRSLFPFGKDLSLEGIWASSPLYPIAVLFTLSWFFANQIPGPQPLLSWTSGFLALFLLLASMLKKVGGRPQAILIVLSLGFFAFSYFRFGADFPDNDSISLWKDKIPEEVEILGTIKEKPEKPLKSTLPSWNREPRVSFLVELKKMKWPGSQRTASGLILVRCPGFTQDFPVGHLIRVHGKFRNLPKPMNPGENPPMLYWRRKGVEGTLDCREIPDVGQYGVEGISLQRLLIPLREWASGRLGYLLEGEDTGLAEALLLGNTRAVDSSEWDKFRKTGTIHVLAISGQHLIVAGAIFTGFLSLLRMRSRNALILSTIFVVLYALITGAQPSAVRASIMTVALGTSWLLGRKTPVINILCLAWISIGLIQPNDFTSPGCQLSFLAVLLLDGWLRWKQSRQMFLLDGQPTPGEILDRLEVQLRPIWKQNLYHSFHWIKELFLVNAWVWVGLCPLLWWHTNLISLSALILGPIIAVCCTVALGCGMVAVLVPIPYMDRFLALVGNQFLHWTKVIAEWGESLPLSWFYKPNIPFWFIFAWLVVIALLLIPRQTWINKKILAAMVAWLILGIAFFPMRMAPDGLLVQTIAVGHGTAVLIEEPSGRVVLYDGGSMSGGDQAGRIIAQVLWKKGINRLDDIIISHADSDHFNAIISLLERFTVEMVSAGPSFQKRDDKEAADFFQRLNKTKVPFQVIARGFSALSGGVFYSVIHPDPDYENPPTQNAASIVLAISAMGQSVLLTGDLEPPGTQKLLAQPDLPRPILALMAPHHGSPAANPDYLWKRFSPSLVFSSEGEERRTRQAGGNLSREIPLWKTQEKGMITIEIGPKNIRALAFATGEIMDLGAKEGKRKD